MRQRGSTRLNTLLILLIVALLASVAVPTWQAHYGFGDKEGFRTNKDGAPVVRHETLGGARERAGV